MAKGKNSKSEAREKRKREKQEKNIQKNIRLSNRIRIPNKRIRSPKIPDITEPRKSVSESNYKTLLFEWNINHADLEGQWSWGEPRNWDNDEYSKIIAPRFNKYMSNTWQEVELQDYNGAGGYRKRINKYQDLDTICTEAQERWKNNLKLNQFDELFRCRLGTDRRTWGIRILNHYFLVWYERYHNICPLDND